MLKKILGAIGIIIVLFILLAIILPTPPEEQTQQGTAIEKQTQQERAQEDIKQAEEKSVVAEKPKPTYLIVHSKANHRADGASTYWVLIDPVDVSADAFKQDVENVIRKIIASKGAKISISIFDDSSILELDYKQYGDLSLGRVRTDEESAKMARHLIAMFSGDYELNLYTNELSYFPGAFNDTPEVGQYVDTIEFK